MLQSYIRHALPVFLLMCLVVLTLAPVYSQTLRQARRVVTEGLSADLDASFQLVPPDEHASRAGKHLPAE